jgi:hypothetical protein
MQMFQSFMNFLPGNPFIPQPQLVPQPQQPPQHQPTPDMQSSVTSGEPSRSEKKKKKK